MYTKVMTAFFVLTVIFAGVSSAITFGEPDIGNKYYYVGAMVIAADDFTVACCSGSLIHPRVFLTAAHCIYGFISRGGTVEYLRVTFSNEDALDPSCWLEVEAMYFHPDYDPRIVPEGSIDVGVLILKEPVTDITPLGLPPERYLDDLKDEKALLKADFCRAGYGTMLEWPPPVIIPSDNQRWFAENNKYQGLTKRFIVTSQNNAAGNNGTGYGDSGSPVLWKEPDGSMTPVGVTSIGDPNLVALDKPFRIDIPEALSFIRSKIDEVNSAPPAGKVIRTTITWGNIKSSF